MARILFSIDPVYDQVLAAAFSRHEESLSGRSEEGGISMPKLRDLIQRQPGTSVSVTIGAAFKANGLKFECSSKASAPSRFFRKFTTA